MNTEAGDFAMRNSSRKDIPVRAIAEQIKCRRKASLKLPSLSSYELIYDSVALEQCSGEAAARYKSSLFRGRRMIDLTGGLGIDSYYFSHEFAEVIYCERQQVLSQIARYNFNTLNAVNVEIFSNDGIDALSRYPDGHFDMIYADPARRSEGGRRFTAIKDYSPDVTLHMPLLMKKAPVVMIKVSPAAEIEQIKREIPGITAFHVVSVDGECKEVLVILQRDRKVIVPELRAVMIDSKTGSTEILSSDDNFAETEAETVSEYFYEPDAAIVKSRLTRTLAGKYHGMTPVNTASCYLTSDELYRDFPGRSFKVESVVPYGSLKEFIKKNSIKKANVARRDFPDSPEEIKKRFRISDGGGIYMFFTRNSRGENVCVCTKKVD